MIGAVVLLCGLLGVFYWWLINNYDEEDSRNAISKTDITRCGSGGRRRHRGKNKKGKQKGGEGCRHVGAGRNIKFFTCCHSVCYLRRTPVYLYRTLLFQRLPIDLAWIACEKQWPQQARLRRCSPRLSLQKPPPATSRDHRTGKGPPIRDWMPRSGQLSVELHR